MLAKHSYRPDIDGLRAIAVLSVVAFHAAPRIVRGGFLGVDIFFVISGYLITAIILKGLQTSSFSFLEFYGGRIRRILPALIVVLSAAWLIGWFVLPPDDYTALGRRIIAASIFASNFELMKSSGYFDAPAALNPVLHLWSLAVEEQFYLIWPLALSVVWKWRFNALPLLGMVATASFILCVVGGDPSDFFSPTTRTWELALGALLAANMPMESEISERAIEYGLKTRPLCIRNALSSVGLALIVASIFLLNGNHPYPGWRTLLPTSGAVLVIAAGPHTFLNRHLLSNWLMVGIGLMSYPLYLWHWPLLAFMRISAFGELSTAAKLYAISAAFLFAWLTYVLIERPIRFGNWPIIAKQAVMPCVLVALLCVIGTAGFATEFADFPDRLPQSVRSLVDYRFDWTEEYRVAKCLLNPGQDAKDFASECVDSSAGDTQQPLVLLWGDSHAAHLYPGLRRLQRRAGFSLAQLTMSACPPLLDISISVRPTCEHTNSYDIDRIGDLRPEIVILAAKWWAYPTDFPVKDVGNIVARSIAAIRKRGIEKIILVGPVPAWNPSLADLLTRVYWLKQPHELPRRMKYGLTEFTDLDETLAAAAKKYRISFVSPRDVFCNSEGCLTRVGDNAADITA